MLEMYIQFNVLNYRRVKMIKLIINFVKIVLTKWKYNDNINLQTKQQTTYKNLINDEKVDRKGNVRGS